MANGEVCWLEINTPKVEEATKFYTGLFGWERGAGEVGFPYQFLKRPKEERNFGGVMGQTQADVPPNWLVYFGVQDLDAALKRVVELGGRTLSPVVSLPQGSKFAAVSDPHGAAFALFQA